MGLRRLALRRCEGFLHPCQGLSNLMPAWRFPRPPYATSLLVQRLDSLSQVTKHIFQMLNANAIKLIVQSHDLDLGLQVHLIVQAGGQSVASRLTILRHQDYRRLKRCDH